MNLLVAVVESKGLNRSIKGLAMVLGLAASAVLFLLIIITAVDVLLRGFAGTPIPGAIQYSELLLVGVAFLALADGQRYGDHVALELVTSRLPERVAYLLTALGYVVVVVVLLIATWISFEIAVDSFQRGESRIGIVAIPTWPARAVIPLGMFALSLMMSLQALKYVAIASGRLLPERANASEVHDFEEGR